MNVIKVEVHLTSGTVAFESLDILKDFSPSEALDNMEDFIDKALSVESGRFRLGQICVRISCIEYIRASLVQDLDDALEELGL